LTRLFAALAQEEADRLEACRFSIEVAYPKYHAGAKLSDTEAGLDARTIYITLGRHGSRGDPASSSFLGSGHETPSGTETEGESPRKSGPGEASTPPAAPASGLSIEAPQQDGVPREGA